MVKKTSWTKKPVLISNNSAVILQDSGKNIPLQAAELGMSIKLS